MRLPGSRGMRAVWAALAFSNPLMTYSYLIFPELPAGLCVIYAFRRLALGWQANGPFRLVLTGLALAFLPWLHSRFLPITGMLLLFALSLAITIFYNRSALGRRD